MSCAIRLGEAGGAGIVPELDTGFLFLMARRAYNRWQFPALLVEVLSEEKDMQAVRRFPGQYFALRGLPAT